MRTAVLVAIACGAGCAQLFQLDHLGDPAITGDAQTGDADGLSDASIDAPPDADPCAPQVLDDFKTGTIDTNIWNIVPTGTTLVPRIQNGQLVIPMAPNTADANIQAISVATFDLTNAAVELELVPGALVQGTDVEVWIRNADDSVWYAGGVWNGLLVFDTSSSGVDTIGQPDPITQRWIRVRHRVTSGSNLVTFETSATTLNWATRSATQFFDSVNAMRVSVYTWTRESVASPGEGRFDNIRIRRSCF